MSFATDTFTIHMIEGHISAIYLAVYPDKILVLDGGCKCDVPKIEVYIKKNLNRNLSTVKLVIASHTHPDHAGGSPVFSKRNSLPLAAPRYINSWYKGATGYIQHKIDTLLGYHVARVTGKPFSNIFYDRRVDYDIPLYDGDRLPGFEDWMVIDAPGHTSHDMVFYNEDAGILYAADVILCVNGKYLLPFPVPLNDHMTETLERLSTLKVKTLMLAHGGVIETGGRMKPITDELLALLKKGLPPALKKLKYLEYFSPEIKKAKNRKKAA